RLARGRDQIPLAPADGLAEEGRDLREVPIVRVAGQELIVPLQSARVDIEGHESVGIEIRPRPEMTGEVGGGIRDGDVQLSFCGIERQRTPDRPPSLRNALGVRPGLRPRLAWAGHGVEPPHGLTVGEPEGPDPPPNVVLPAGWPD